MVPGSVHNVQTLWSERAANAAVVADLRKRNAELEDTVGWLVDQVRALQAA